MRHTWILAALLLVGGFGAPANARSPDGSQTRSRREVADTAAGTCPVCAAARRFGLLLTPLQRIQVYRCVTRIVSLAMPLSPRGLVREEDLQTAAIWLNDDYVAGDLEWQSGGQVVGTEPYDPLRVRDERPIPAAAQLAILHGGTVRWGVLPKGRGLVLATIRLGALAPEDSATWERIGSDLARDPAFLVPLLRGQLLRRAGFDTGALAEARRALDAHPGEPHALALALSATCALRLKNFDDRNLVTQVRDAIESRRTAGERCRLDDVWDAETVGSGCDECDDAEGQLR